jgi:hypothetical protein
MRKPVMRQTSIDLVTDLFQTREPGGTAKRRSAMAATDPAASPANTHQ